MYILTDLEVLRAVAAGAHALCVLSVGHGAARLAEIGNGRSEMRRARYCIAGMATGRLAAPTTLGPRAPSHAMHGVCCVHIHKPTSIRNFLEKTTSGHEPESQSGAARRAPPPSLHGPRQTRAG